MEAMNRSAAELVREYGPFPGVDQVHGVTFDGQQVWFASGDKLNAFDPSSGKTLRSNGRSSREARDAARCESFGARVRWRRSVLLRRRTEREGQDGPAAQTGLRKESLRRRVTWQPTRW